MAQLNAEIPQELKKQFDLHCVKNNLTKKEAVVLALENFIKGVKK